MIGLYIGIALVVLAGIYFGFVRKKPAELAPGESTKGELRAKSDEPKSGETPPKPAPKELEPKRAEPALKAKSEQPVQPKSEPAVRGDEPVAAPKAKSEAPKETRKESVRPPPSKKDVEGIRKGLAATRGGFIAKLKAIFTGKKEINPAILEAMEEVMISSDVGVKTTQAILGRLRERLEKKELDDEAAVWTALRAEASDILGIAGGPLKTGGEPTVVLMVGVNGVGKTTTIGKLATRAKEENKKVMLAAGDTFRAAAVQQLEVWGKRVGAEVVKGKDGADPGAVAFDATTKAREAKVDFLFVDTAGRLHTKAPLMDEIKKVRKTINKAYEGAPHETWLVLDATTGQNALTQAAMFKDAVDLTGLVLTKLDGTAKGGVVLGICDELKVPVRYIGLGERAEDLRELQAEECVEALFGGAEEGTA
ncbi:signal recognition particle-docking protein FtsY [soil metagenome]